MSQRGADAIEAWLSVAVNHISIVYDGDSQWHCVDRQGREWGSGTSPWKAVQAYRQAWRDYYAPGAESYRQGVYNGD